MYKITKVVVKAALFFMFSQVIYAGGFSLYTEGSGAAIGNFAAGIAAEAADASIGWYNPAGLVLIQKSQAVFSGVGVLPNTKLAGTSTFDFSANAPEALANIPAYVQKISGLQAAKNAFVPAFHYAKPLGDRATFGFSVVSPFGLSTDYPNSSPVRHAATHTELLTVNASPELGGKLTDNIAIGGGLDFQWAQVKFNRMLGAPIFSDPLFPGFTPTSLDSLSYNQGNSFAIGFHAGILILLNQNHTRIGLNYQSKMEHEFDGYSRLTGPLADPDVTDAVGSADPSMLVPGAVFRSDNLSSEPISLPDILTLSIYQDVNERLALLGSVILTGWDSFKVITLNNVAAGSPLVGQFITDRSFKQNYKNTLRLAAGANYRVNELITARAGVGYDQTPTVDVYREVRLPDTSRLAIAIGGHYQAHPSVGFDFGYSYLWAVKDPQVNKTENLTSIITYNVNARGNVHAHLVGVQAVWTIDKPSETK